MKTNLLLILALALPLAAQTHPCDPFQPCNCISMTPPFAGQFVACPAQTPPVTPVEAVYPPLVELPFYAELVGPWGPLQSVNMCPAGTCQVTLKADAAALMAAISPAITAKTGQYPGATLTLIQGFGNDQNPGQPAMFNGFAYVPSDPSDLRRVWYVYTTTGQIVVGSAVQALIEIEDAKGVGAPGAWAWQNVYPQTPAFKQLVWVAN
jgi:hypothetical protein